MNNGSSALRVSISELHLRVFGGASDMAITFKPGLNIVTGDNESGKSTLFRAIQHSILTATNLDKRTLARELDPYFPRPDGNFAECTISLQAAGLLKVRRRWGADAEEEATLPDGSLVRGADGVSGAIDRFLPVSAATFRTVLLADQTQLDQTAELLRNTPEARDEAAGALRSARLAVGGVSPEAFTRLLDEQLAALLGQWDTTRNQPRDGRRYTEPWIRGAGRLVKAFYVVQELEADLEAVLRSENELERARLTLEESGGRFRTLSTFVTEHGESYALLNAVRGLSGEIAANEERLKTLREDNRRWPVLQRDCSDLDQKKREIGSRRSSLDAELVAARGHEERAAALQKLNRVDRILTDLTEARGLLEETTVVDEKALAELREVEAQLPYAEARLSSGHLRATVDSQASRVITVSSDGGETEQLETGADEPVNLTASRHLLIESEGLRIEMETGEERFEDLRAARDALLSQRDHLRQVIGADTVAEAQARQALHTSANSRLKQLEQSICHELDVADVRAALAAREELARAAGHKDAEGAGAAGPAAIRKQSVITDEISEVSQQLGAVGGQLENAREQLRKLTEGYGSQDQLENQLGETNRLLSGLVSRQEKEGAVPAGFKSATEFLAVFEEQQRDRERASDSYNADRVSYAETIGSQPERNSDEIRIEIDEARVEFDRLSREAQSLERVRQEARKVLEELDETVFDPFVARVAAYAGVLTAGRYLPELGEDPLGPERFARGTTAAAGAAGERAAALPYELLSQGTKDSLALAVRLALAETVLGANSAPFVLDDPLVDMDPPRRAIAAAALTKFAEQHQVIVLTCHPEHSALFPDGYQITLPDR